MVRIGFLLASTCQDLLKDDHDEALFDHYFTRQLARMAIHETVTPTGNPQTFWEMSPSPSGRLLLIETIHRPISIEFRR